MVVHPPKNRARLRVRLI